MQFELFKEKELKNNCNSLIRTVDPFGVIPPHIEHTHGYDCQTLPGGLMHAIFQFFISIEKVILLPVTLKIEKSLSLFGIFAKIFQFLILLRY